MCADFFESGGFEQVVKAPIEKLMLLALHALKKLSGKADIVVGIDEIALLGMTNAKFVVSLASELAKLYWENTGSICVGWISSLNAAFTTSSGRAIIDWTPDRAGVETFSFFAQQLALDKRQHFISLSKAICGTHMRSIVLCYEEMRKGSIPSVDTLFGAMQLRLGVKLGNNDYSAIIERVRTCMIDTVNKACDPRIEALVGADGALCPAIMQLAFCKMAPKVNVHLMALFRTLAKRHANGKSLEEFSMQFDFFRASMRVPVVPGKATVRMSEDSSKDQPPDWYRKLGFPDAMQLSTENILKVVDEQTTEKKKRKVLKVTATKPSFGKYYHRESDGHPRIDRCYVAKHTETGADCLVLS